MPPEYNILLQRRRLVMENIERDRQAMTPPTPGHPSAASFRPLAVAPPLGFTPSNISPFSQTWYTRGYNSTREINAVHGRTWYRHSSCPSSSKATAAKSRMPISSVSQTPLVLPANTIDPSDLGVDASELASLGAAPACHKKDDFSATVLQVPTLSDCIPHFGGQKATT